MYSIIMKGAPLLSSPLLSSPLLSSLSPHTHTTVCLCTGCLCGPFLANGRGTIYIRVHRLTSSSIGRVHSHFMHHPPYTITPSYPHTVPPLLLYPSLLVYFLVRHSYLSFLIFLSCTYIHAYMFMCSKSTYEQVARVRACRA